MTTIHDWVFESDYDLNKQILSTQSGSYSYRDIHKGVEEYVLLLESLGDLSKKKVVLIVPTAYNFISLVLAVSKLGGISIPLSPLLRKEDLQSVLHFADPHIVFTASEHNGFQISETVHNWAVSSNKETVIFTEDESLRWIKNTISGEKRLVEECKAQIIGFTSGSTGTPKGVMVDVDFFKRASEALIFGLSLDHREKLFLAGPAVGIYGLCYLLSSLRDGYHLVVTESFNFPEIIQLLEEHPSKKLMTTPSLFRGIDLFNKSLGKTVLDSIELLCIGGEAVTKEFMQTYSHLSLKIMNLYGLTELGPVFYSDSDIRDNGHLTLLPNVNYTLESVSDEGIGELLIKTNNPFLGYYKRPDLTYEVYKEGWYFSGDLARKTGDGKIDIIGRKKEMIKKGGQQVIPGEIEKYLGSHPNVEKAVVVGVPHPVFGEQIIAFVKKKDEFEKNELFEFCKNKIARYKIPDQIQFIDEFPMIQGKIDKVTLRKLAAKNN